MGNVKTYREQQTVILNDVAAALAYAEDQLNELRMLTEQEEVHPSMANDKTDAEIPTETLQQIQSAVDGANSQVEGAKENSITPRGH